MFILKSIKLFISAFLSSIRRTANTEILVDDEDFEYAFETQHFNYHLTVQRTIFKTVYTQWYIPSLKRELFKVTLREVKGLTVNNEYIEYYPRLSLNGRWWDKTYPHLCLASIHISRYFNTS